MFDKKRPSLEDVAIAAGVSTATISRCINAPQKVAEPTRKRIQNAIETLGYVPHFGGRALASNRANTVGAIIPSMDNAMFAGGLQAFQEVLSEAGVTLLVGSSNYDPDHEYNQIRSLMSQGADGLLLIGQSRPQKTRDLLEQHNTPHVLAWCHTPNATTPMVGFDNQKSAAAITQHVLASGHRKLAVIAGITDGNDRATARIAGIKAAVANTKGAELLAVEEAKYSFSSAADAVDRVLSSSEIPTALICGSDVLAVGAMMRVKECGLNVPNDISITGFDDINLAHVTTPALTTVRIPQRDMGRKAAQVLLNILSGGADRDLSNQIELATQIIDRGTLRQI